MLDERTIDKLTREARPVDFWMLRSYVRRAPSVEYARRVMIPSLRERHRMILERIESQAPTE